MLFIVGSITVGNSRFFSNSYSHVADDEWCEAQLIRGTRDSESHDHICWWKQFSGFRTSLNSRMLHETTNRTDFFWLFLLLFKFYILLLAYLCLVLFHILPRVRFYNDCNRASADRSSGAKAIFYQSSVDLIDLIMLSQHQQLQTWHSSSPDILLGASQPFSWYLTTHEFRALLIVGAVRSTTRMFGNNIVSRFYRILFFIMLLMSKYVVNSIASNFLSRYRNNASKNPQ